MKVVEKIFEDMMRKKVKINEMLFGFMPRGTIDAIFIVIQICGLREGI